MAEADIDLYDAIEEDFTQVRNFWNQCSGSLHLKIQSKE